MIAGFEVEGGLLADLAQCDEVVFAAGGNSVDDGVLDGAHRLREIGFSIRRSLRQLFHAGGQLLRLGEQRLLFITLRLGNLLAEGLLACAQGLGFGDGGAAANVGLKGRVDELNRRATSTLGRFDGVGVFTKQLRVDHSSSLFGLAWPTVAHVTVSEKRAAVVFNPVKVDEDALRALVAQAQQEAGWADTLWFATTEDEPGTSQAVEAVAQGATVVLAAGGDGTVRCVAAGLHNTDVALCLLPSGTGNLLARNLELSLDLAQSVTTAFTGEDRPIDVGIVEAERADSTRESFIFLVMAGVGLDAQMLQNTNPELKKRVGWLAYVDAIARSLRGNGRIRMRFSVDGSVPRAMSAHTVLIGNCGTLPGNFLLLPDAVVDDGIFDVVALRPQGFIGWVQIWVKVVWENGVLRRSQVGRKMLSYTKEIRTLRYLKGKEFVARLTKPEEFELDGDPFGTAIALKASVDPLSMKIRMPAA